MSILVKLHGRLRMAAGADEVEIPEKARNVGDLLEELTRRLGQDGEDRQLLGEKAAISRSPEARASRVVTRCAMSAAQTAVSLRRRFLSLRDKPDSERTNIA